MLNYAMPVVDEHNPFYCPAVSAGSYLLQLRSQLRRPYHNYRRRSYQVLNKQLLHSFARILDGPTKENINGYGDASKCGQPLYSRTLDMQEDTTLTVSDSTLNQHLPKATLTLKRKRLDTSGSFSDLGRPAKYAKSYQSIHESSFEVGLIREKLRYSTSSVQSPPRPVEKTAIVNYETDHNLVSTINALASRVCVLECDLYGPPIGTETPRSLTSFIARLDAMIPGIRLKERLSNLENLSHQSIADHLGVNGLLHARVLETMRTSEIRCLWLGSSMADEGGLNISGNDILPVFSKPNSFFFLAELSICGTPVPNYDLRHIQHLPRLSILTLDDTGIGNEAMYIITALKRSLTRLSICRNPAIDDDAIPALLLLSKLSFLSIIDTGIGMPGLRRFAATVFQEDRIIDIESPGVCEKYIATMHTKYLVDPAPPLITNPDACSQLSIAALKRNLQAHATCNKRIISTGTKAEMRERLYSILRTRNLDLMVRDLIFGTDESDTSEASTSA